MSDLLRRTTVAGLSDMYQYHQYRCLIAKVSRTIKVVLALFNRTRGWREVTVPPYLFPNATSIKVGGCMTRTFLSRILAPPFDRFTSIETKNLMRWSEFEPALPEGTHLRELSAYVYRANPQKTSDTRLMVGALDPLIGCCSNLTNLHITTVGMGTVRPRKP